MIVIMPIEEILLTMLLSGQFVLKISLFVALLNFLYELEMIFPEGFDYLGQLGVLFWRGGVMFEMVFGVVDSKGTFEGFLVHGFRARQNLKQRLFRNSINWALVESEIKPKCQCLAQIDYPPVIYKSNLFAHPNNLGMEDNFHQKVQPALLSKERTVVSLFLEDTRQRSEKAQFAKNEARKTLFSDSLFSQNNQSKYPKVARKTSVYNYETKSLKEHELRGSVSRTTFQCRKQQNQQLRRQDTSNHYNQNLFRLKVEEMIFKFKTKIGMLLRQMSISVTELSQFTELTKIDEILDFLAEKIKEMIRLNQFQASTNEKGKRRDLDIINQYEVQIEALKKRIFDRENTEKGYKERLKQAHHEIRELYDKIGRKQKELSTKMTEIYQIKTIKSESDKLISTLTDKCLNLEKDNAQIHQTHTSQFKKLQTKLKALEQDNQELKEKVEELTELNQRYSGKQNQILAINIQLNEQLQRWRERFESQSISSGQFSHKLQANKQKAIITASTIDIKEGSLNEGGKYSELALLNQNSRLAFKITELERQNKDLSNELTLIGRIKVKYDELRTCLKSSDILQSPSKVSSSSQNNRNRTKEALVFEVEEHYKKKMEENAKEWKQKLVDIVNTYEQEMEINRKEIKRLIKSQQELQAKIHQLANQKYHAETQLIQKQREIYELSRNSRDSCRVINSIELPQPEKYKSPDWEGVSTYQISITSNPDPQK